MYLFADEFGISPVLQLDGMTDAINGLFGGGSVRLFNGATLVVGNTINGSQGIGDYYGFISGDGSLIKRGPGTFKLADGNEYTGGTRVESGILLIENFLHESATGPGAVTVASGGSLGGTGRTQGTVTVQSGGAIFPGGDGLVDADREHRRVDGQRLDAGSGGDAQNRPRGNNLRHDERSTRRDQRLADRHIGVVAHRRAHAGRRPSVRVMTWETREALFSSISGDTPPGIVLSEIYRGGDLLLLTTAPGEKTWGVDASGDASVGGNWIGGVPPGGVGDSAAFTTIITANRQVTIDAPTTVGTLRFDDNNDYTLVGPARSRSKRRRGARGDQRPQSARQRRSLDRRAGLLASDLDISQDSAGAFSISGSLANSAGRTITKTGGGALAISGPQSHGAGAELIVEAARSTSTATPAPAASPSRRPT